MIVTEWQMYAVCPGCNWYKDGKCLDKRRTDYNAPCEFELTGGKLKTKLVPATPTLLEDGVTYTHS